MPRLTAANTLVLPMRRSHQAPGCFASDRLWFEGDYKPVRDRLDCQCVQALIAKGIGNRECPTIPEWAAFCVAGGVIAALTGRYITPPDPEPITWQAEMNHFVWEALWLVVEEHREGLDHEFLAAMLREFLPREHYAPPDRPYFQSSFEGMWSLLEYPDALMHSIGNVRAKRLQEGEKAFRQLSAEMQAAIKKVARHIPTMLQIANRRIRKTYQW